MKAFVESLPATASGEGTADSEEEDAGNIGSSQQPLRKRKHEQDKPTASKVRIASQDREVLFDLSDSRKISVDTFKGKVYVSTPVILHAVLHDMSFMCVHAGTCIPHAPSMHKMPGQTRTHFLCPIAVPKKTWSEHLLANEGLPQPALIPHTRCRSNSSHCTAHVAL